MNTEQLTLHTHSNATTNSVYQQRVEALMVHAARDGQLTSEEEEIIIAAMTCSGRPTVEVCALFRRLQEQVWDGELLLDRSRK